MLHPLNGAYTHTSPKIEFKPTSSRHGPILKTKPNSYAASNIP
jgi:hypothetical protein